MRMKDFSLVISLAFIFTACNSKTSKKEFEPVQVATQSEAIENTFNVTDDKIAHIVLKSDNKIRFDHSEIRVKEGQEIR